MSTSAATTDATSPWSMSLSSWKPVLSRTWSEAGKDNIGLVAAGVAFYGFLALVPMLGAIVLSYGIVAEPATVMRNMQQLTSVMPADAAKLIGEQLLNVVDTSGGKKGVGLLIALGVALFGARNGAGAIITALNIAYEEDEKRSFVRLNLLVLAITAASVGLAIISMIAIAALGHLESLLPKLPDWLAIVGKVASYVALVAAAAAATATLYRYGPSRQKARWIWITPGSAFTSILWLVLTLGFGTYVANIGHFDATYGSLGTVVALLTWLYLSSYILLFGAELNAELEHQTLQDSTTGSEEPMGDRGAWVADHVADDTKPDNNAAAAQREADATAGQPSVIKQYAAGRLAARGTQFAGFGKVDMAASGLAAFGLARIRKGGQPTAGIAMLAAAGVLAWLKRPSSSSATRAALFDLDGTLVDSNGFHVTAWMEVFSAAGHRVSRDAIQGQIGKGGDLLVPALLPYVSKFEVEQLFDAHGELFKNQYLERVRPFPGARELLTRVHEDGARVVLASSATKAEVEHYIKLLDAEHLVYASTSIDDVRASKPEPDIFASALEKAGANASHAVVIGDTPFDIEAAAACGIPTLALRSGGFSDSRLTSAAVIFDDVQEVLDNFDRSPLAKRGGEQSQPSADNTGQ